MERVQSLINRLTAQLAANASKADMLITAELLRQELSRGATAPMVGRGEAVTVWLPNGFAPRSMQEATMQAQPRVNANTPLPAVQEMPAPANGFKKVTLIQPEKLVEPIPAPAPVVVSNPVPVAEPGEKESLVFHLDLEPVEETILPEEKPIEKIQQIEPRPRPFPAYPDSHVEIRNGFPSAQPGAVGREINEMIAEPVVVLNERLQTKSTELAEVLSAGGPKITDLRKAISINDKYQMINLLFRGDEDMFERSVRTLNNFESLPEARFWMQRELVLKLGWSDEDELAQDFYKLVSRRFA